MPTTRVTSSTVQRLRSAATLVVVLLAPACVPAVRHDKAVAEIDRLRRENLELRKDLAEQTVRLQELVEAVRGGAPAAPAKEPAAGQPPTAGPAGTAPAWTGDGSRTPASVATFPPLDAIQEEQIRDPGAGGPADEGERTLWVARQYAGEGKTAESLEAYTKFIQNYPFSPLLPEAFLERGRGRLKTGDRQGARDDFMTIVEAFPDSRLVPEARREASALGGS